MDPVVDTRMDDAPEHDPELLELADLLGKVCEKCKGKPTPKMIEAGILGLSDYNPREDPPRFALACALLAMMDHE